MTGHPSDALLAVTYKCNARCVMCNIWQTRPKDELSPKEWRNIPTTLRDINISGGEPFLRTDLPQIIEVVLGRCPGARLIISTNGIGPERIRESMQRIVRIRPGIGVGVSIDGIGEVHDRIRGVKGAYDQAIESLHMMRKVGVKNLRIAFTAVEGNVHQMNRVYRLSRALGVEFSCVVAHDSEIYFRTSGNRLKSFSLLREQLNLVARRELRSSAPKRWLRSYFYRGLYGYVENGRRILPCMAGDASVFIDPRGDVFPCNVLDLNMGNIRRQGFDTLWNREKAIEVRRKVERCKRPCWMMCSARSSIRKNPLRAFVWVGANKAKAHFGRRSIV